jgi:plasmid stability protein
MTKSRTTYSLDDQVVTAARVYAARTGRGDSDVVEEALRSMLGLDLLDSLWAGADLDEDEAMQLALEAQRATRSPRG